MKDCKTREFPSEVIDAIGKNLRQSTNYREIVVNEQGFFPRTLTPIRPTFYVTSQAGVPKLQHVVGCEIKKSCSNTRQNNHALPRNIWPGQNVARRKNNQIHTKYVAGSTRERRKKDEYEPENRYHFLQKCKAIGFPKHHPCE